MIDRVLNTMISLMLAMLSFVILGVTDFNATYVFSGYSREAISGLGGWFQFAQDHRHLLGARLLLGSSGTVAVVLVASFLMPILPMLIAKPSALVVRIELWNVYSGTEKA